MSADGYLERDNKKL